MWPKTARITTLVLLSLTLTLVAAHNGCPGNSVADVLTHYDIPAGLFPNNVHHFSCDPVSSSSNTDADDDALSISIQLEGVCEVSREVFMIKNVMECEPEISAIVSRNQLTNVKGVTVMLSFANVPVGELMTVSQVKVTPTEFGTVQFYSAEGYKSPTFFRFMIPSQAPNCDDKVYAARFARRFEYRRLLPNVVA